MRDSELRISHGSKKEVYVSLLKKNHENESDLDPNPPSTPAVASIKLSW